MRTKLFWIFIGVCMVCDFSLKAQEINATVSVLTPNIQMTNKQVFTTLETAIREFVNTFQWTNLQYEQEERIECAFVFTINQFQGTSFAGNLQVQYSRPIYSTNYKSPVLNYIDSDVNFSYIENQPLDYQPNTHLGNLTSMLAFYCNLIIGLDRATMSEGGGAPYFAQVQNIVASAQSDGSASGWRSFDGNKSRYWLSDNLNSPAFEPIVTALYNYHRQGLDLMYEEGAQPQAKTTIRDAILSMQDVYEKRPNALLLNTFFDAKSDEIVAIFSDGPELDISKLINSLKLMDAGRTNKYEELMQ